MPVLPPTSQRLLCINCGTSLFEIGRGHLSSISSKQNSLLLSNTNQDNCENVSKDAKSIFQRHFHGCRCCHIIRSIALLVTHTRRFQDARYI